MVDPQVVTDWTNKPNPEAEAFIAAHREAVSKIVMANLLRCQDCKMYLTEAITHTGYRIRVEANHFERFIISDGELHVSGIVLRDHKCRPSNAMSEAQAEHEMTKDFTTEAEWDEFSKAKLRARQERWTAFGDVPDPDGYARGPVAT